MTTPSDPEPQVNRRQRHSATSPRLTILLALGLAIATTGALLWWSRSTSRDEQRASIGQPAPAIVGTTLDGEPFDLTALAGRPVVVNFWGPSCEPCRDEFPLLGVMQSRHASDGLAVVGVLMDDPVVPAHEFVAAMHASWPTVVDQEKASARAYRVAARPQSYFIDGGGVIRSIQVGILVESDFERQYALIAPPP